MGSTNPPGGAILTSLYATAVNPSLAQIAREVPLPVNVEISDGMPSIPRLIKAGVSRISHSLVPYMKAMTALETEAAKLFSR